MHFHHDPDSRIVQILAAWIRVRLLLQNNQDEIVLDTETSLQIILIQYLYIRKVLQMHLYEIPKKLIRDNITKWHLFIQKYAFTPLHKQQQQ